MHNDSETGGLPPATNMNEAETTPGNEISHNELALKHADQDLDMGEPSSANDSPAAQIGDITIFDMTGMNHGAAAATILKVIPPTPHKTTNISISEKPSGEEAKIGEEDSTRENAMGGDLSSGEILAEDNQSNIGEGSVGSNLQTAGKGSVGSNLLNTYPPQPYTKLAQPPHWGRKEQLHPPFPAPIIRRCSPCRILAPSAKPDEEVDFEGSP